LEVYSSVTNKVLETVTIGSDGEVTHDYPFLVGRRLDGDRSAASFSFVGTNGELKDRAADHGRVLVEVQPSSVLNKNNDPGCAEVEVDKSEFALGAAHDKVPPPRMIIVRPFSPWDIDKLESSFDEWERYLPCTANSM
jgi:hypothetical protein